DELYKRIPIEITVGTGGTSFFSKAEVFISDNDFTAGKNAVQIAVGARATCALTGDANVYCWGFNTNGQLGNGTNVSTSTPTKMNLTGISGVPTAIDMANDYGCLLT